MVELVVQGALKYTQVKIYNLIRERCKNLVSTQWAVTILKAPINSPTICEIDFYIIKI